jgi:O-antigen ligase
MTTLVTRHGIHDNPTLEKVLLWGAGILVVASLAVGSYGAATVGLLALASLVLTWRRAVIALMAVVMLIPVHLYDFPIPSPFGKPDRAIVVPMLVFFLAAALGTRRVQFRATPMGLPLALFGVVMAAAFVFGGTELAYADVFSDTLKKGLFFLGFFVAFFVTASVLRVDDARFVMRWLVLFGLIVAVFAFLAKYTGFNFFRSEQHYIPLLQPSHESLDVTYTRQGNGPARMVGSAAHPIEFAVVMTMLVAPAAYLARTARGTRRAIFWAAAAVVIMAAALTSGSRTSAVALGVAFLASAALRPKRLPLLAVVGVLGLGAGFAVAPDSIHAISSAFSSGNAEQQKTNMQGRTEDFGPVIDQFASSPLIGHSYGYFTPQRFFFVDNTYLKLLPDLGALGLFMLFFVFWRALRMSWRAAKARAPGDDYSEGAAAVFVSCLVFVVCGVLYDQLDFTQVTYVFFLLAALGAVFYRAVVEETPEWSLSPARWPSPLPIVRSPA